MEPERDGDTNCNWYVWNNLQRIRKRIGGLGYKRTSKYHPTYSNIKIGQNIEKSPKDEKKLVVAPTPKENHQLTISTKPSARAGYDTRSIFRRSLTGLNSEFSFS